MRIVTVSAAPLCGSRLEGARSQAGAPAWLRGKVVSSPVGSADTMAPPCGYWATTRATVGFAENAIANFEVRADDRAAAYTGDFAMATQTATRRPAPPPFEVGERLEYVGPLRFYRDDVCLLGRGMTGTVVSTHPGRRGTGRLVDLDDGEEPFVDETTDGYSVVVTVNGFRRIAAPDVWRRAAP